MSDKEIIELYQRGCSIDNIVERFPRMERKETKQRKEIRARVERVIVNYLNKER